MFRRYAVKASVCTLIMPILLLTCSAYAVEKSTDDSTSIYASKTSAADQIKAALDRASRSNRRVLLDFGADWCPWCRALHKLMTEDKDIRHKLASEYEVVYVDVDKNKNADVDERYGKPTKLGLPVLVVLDADGKQLVTQETGSLEEGKGHDPEKVLAFLKKYQRPPTTAGDQVKQAIAAAGRDGKDVFLYFTAPWCPWCHRLGEFLARKDVAAILNDSFVIVAVDIERTRDGKEIMARYRGNDETGIPYFVILAPDGNGNGDTHKLADAIGPDGNVGFPVEPQEIDYFLTALRKGTDISTKEETTLRSEFKAVVEKPKE